MSGAIIIAPLVLCANMRKTCNKCQESKDLLCFHKDTSKADGFYTICKECRKPIGSKYYRENKERLNKQNAEWGKRNKERVNELARQRYWRNIFKSRKTNRDYHRERRKKNKDL